MVIVCQENDVCQLKYSAGRQDLLKRVANLEKEGIPSCLGGDAMEILPVLTRLSVQAVPPELCLQCSVKQALLCYGATISNYTMARRKNPLELMQGWGNEISFRFTLSCALFQTQFLLSDTPAIPRSCAESIFIWSPKYQPTLPWEGKKLVKISHSKIPKAVKKLY